MQRSQVFFQQWMDSYIIASYPNPSPPPSLSPSLPSNLSVTAVLMPTPSYTSSSFTSIVGSIAGLLLIIVFNCQHSPVAALHPHCSQALLPH